MIRKNCKKCGRFMWKYPSQYNTKYCSKRCASISLRVGSDVSCKSCGKEFHLKPSAIKKGYGRFCSQKCYNESMRKGENRNCVFCGNEFYVGRGELSKGKNRGMFCSSRCKGKHENPKLYLHTYHLRQKILKRKYSKEDIEKTNDKYIKRQIWSCYNLPFKDIPEQLIELKRLNIKRKRKLKEITHGNSQ